MIACRWFDADTVILNPAVPWTLFLPPSDFDDIHMLGTRDQNGFNAGMIMLRVCEWSVKALAETIALRELKPEVKFDFFDQGALKCVAERPGYEEHVRYQPHNWWNAFGFTGKPVASDRFMLHFAGIDCCGQEESKGVVMGRWVDRLENTPEFYATPLENTTYPTEVELYWDRLKLAKTLMENAESHQGDTESGSKDLQKAKEDLNRTVTEHADESDKVEQGIKKLEDLIRWSDKKAEKQNEAADNRGKKSKQDRI